MDECFVIWRPPVSEKPSRTTWRTSLPWGKRCRLTSRNQRMARTKRRVVFLPYTLTSASSSIMTLHLIRPAVYNNRMIRTRWWTFALPHSISTIFMAADPTINLTCTNWTSTSASTCFCSGIPCTAAATGTPGTCRAMMLSRAARSSETRVMMRTVSCHSSRDSSCAFTIAPWKKMTKWNSGRFSNSSGFITSTWCSMIFCRDLSIPASSRI